MIGYVYLSGTVYVICKSPNQLDSALALSWSSLVEGTDVNAKQPCEIELNKAGSTPLSRPRLSEATKNHPCLWPLRTRPLHASLQLLDLLFRTTPAFLRLMPNFTLRRRCILVALALLL